MSAVGLDYGHIEDHWAPSGLCQCPCADCTLRLTEHCVCEDCPLRGHGRSPAGGDVMSTLPPFPVDDATLDLLWAALNPDPEIFTQSGVGNFLQFMSEMGGSDTSAVAEVVDDGSDGGASIVMMRDPQYHVNSVLEALVEEIRRLRAARAGGGE